MEGVTIPHPLIPLDWPDVLSWFVAHQGEPVDVTVSTYPGGVVFDGGTNLTVHDCRPGRKPAHLRLDLPGGLRLYVHEAHVHDPIVERETGHLTLLLPGNVALELRPLT